MNLVHKFFNIVNKICVDTSNETSYLNGTEFSTESSRKSAEHNSELDQQTNSQVSIRNALRH